MSDESHRQRVVAILEQYETTNRPLKAICREQSLSEYAYRNYIFVDLELGSRHAVAADVRRQNNFKQLKNHFGTGYSK